MTLPGRGPKTSDERVADAIRSQPVNSADGLIQTRKANRRPPTVPIPPIGDLAVACRDRLTTQWFTDDIEGFIGGGGQITDLGGYDAAFDYDGFGVQLNGGASSDDGRVYLFGEGIYCATVQIAGQRLSGASSDQTLGVNMEITDRPDGEDFGGVSRGGDPETASNVTVSTTFYSEGPGFDGAGIKLEVGGQNLVNADVGRVWVTILVQKIIAFA